MVDDDNDDEGDQYELFVIVSILNETCVWLRKKAVKVFDGFPSSGDNNDYSGG